MMTDEQAELAVRLYRRFFVRTHFFHRKAAGRVARPYRYHGNPHSACGHALRGYEEHQGDVVIGLLGDDNKLMPTIKELGILDLSRGVSHLVQGSNPWALFRKYQRDGSWRNVRVFREYRFGLSAEQFEVVCAALEDSEPRPRPGARHAYGVTADDTLCGRGTEKVLKREEVTCKLCLKTMDAHVAKLSSMGDAVAWLEIEAAALKCPCGAVTRIYAPPSLSAACHNCGLIWETPATTDCEPRGGFTPKQRAATAFADLQKIETLQADDPDAAVELDLLMGARSPNPPHTPAQERPEECTPPSR